MSSPAPSNPITPDNHGAYVTITAGLLLAFMLLVYLVRVMIRTSFNGPFKLDDVAVSIATLFAVVQSIVVVLEVQAGLGKREQHLSNSQVVTVEKYGYADDLLYIITMSISRSATCLLMARLTRTSWHLLLFNGFAVISLVWGFVGVLTIALRCDLGHPWVIVNAQCTGLAARWIAVGAIGIVIETALCIFPIVLVWNLQMGFVAKLLVLSAFSFRLPMIAAGVLRIFYMVQAIHSSDYIFERVSTTVCAEIEVHYGLIAATIPCMRPFLRAFNTGFYGVDAGQTENTWGTHSATKNSNSYGLQSKISGWDMSSRRNNKASFRPDVHNTVTNAEYDDSRRRGDNASNTSDGSDKMIIRRTDVWEVNTTDHAI